MDHAVRPEQQIEISDRDLDALLQPGSKYARPIDVLTDPVLTNEQRRAVLSAWASDACAVTSCPALRRPAFAVEPVTFDEIMDAMRELDRVAPLETGSTSTRMRQSVRSHGRYGPRTPAMHHCLSATRVASDAAPVG